MSSSANKNKNEMVVKDTENRLDYNKYLQDQVYDIKNQNYERYGNKVSLTSITDEEKLDFKEFKQRNIKYLDDFSQFKLCNQNKFFRDLRKASSIIEDDKEHKGGNKHFISEKSGVEGEEDEKLR